MPKRHGWDKTVLSCLVRVSGANRIRDKSKLSATENFETILSSLEMRWGLLKIVMACRRFCSHHRQDKTMQSCSGVVSNSQVGINRPTIFDVTPLFLGAQRLFVTYWEIILKCPLLYSLHIYWQRQERGNSALQTSRLLQIDHYLLKPPSCLLYTSPSPRD